MSGTRRVETEYPAKHSHSFSNLQNFIQIEESFRPRPRHNMANSFVIRGAVSLATPTANRKRERSVDSGMVETDRKKWKG
jgi:hypothetical protein